MTTWAEPNDYDPEIHLIVEIDIEKFDKQWKKNPFYVPSNQVAPTNLLKYSIWNKRHDKKGYRAEMSTVAVGDDGSGNQVVGFVDGRHRYATYRDKGKRKIPMMIKKDNLDLFEKILNN
jgi:hypothetical protein